MALAASSPRAGTGLIQEGAQFRATAHAVAVHVLVRRDGRPVTDLGPHEFGLTDNGVPQDVRVVAASAVPLDVALVAQRTTWIGREAVAPFESELAEVAALLDDADRIQVVTAGDDVWEMVPLSAPPIAPAIGPRPLDRCVPLYDALASVLMRPPEAGRQQVVIAMTQGEGEGNIVNAESLRQIARRSPALMYVLIQHRSIGDTNQHPQPRWKPTCASMFADWREDRRGKLREISGIRSLHELERAAQQYDRARLVDMAETTGGGEIRSGIFSSSITGPVRRVLADVRSGYVLYYEPSGVSDRGWHPIRVTVTRQGKFEVRARPGYVR